MVYRTEVQGEYEGIKRTQMLYGQRRRIHRELEAQKWLIDEEWMIPFLVVEDVIGSLAPTPAEDEGGPRYRERNRIHAALFDRRMMAEGYPKSSVVRWSDIEDVIGDLSDPSGFC